MATVEIRDAQGGVVGTRELPAEIFERPINIPLMHQVVVAGAAAQRGGDHSTKTRGDVSGGGVKPWRQKGTGRARQGSIRSPQWVGGGIAHGPKTRDYTVRVNKKMRRAALRSALSDAVTSGKLAVVDALAFDQPKTREATRLLDALELQGRILLVIAEPHQAVEKSFRNLAFVKIEYPGNLSTVDLLRADRVLFTGQALDALVEGRRAWAEVTEPAQEEASPPPEPDGPGETDRPAEKFEEPEAPPATEGPGTPADTGEVEP
jgi:large subunit ribosomal protein L4